MDDVPVLPCTALLPILDRVSEAIVIAAPDPWRMLYANPAAARWLATPAEGDDPPLEIIPLGRTTHDILQHIETFWNSGEVAAVLPTDVTIGGETRTVTLHACRLEVEGQPLLGLVIREQPESSDGSVAFSAARLDPLTGLPDRSFLLSRLAELMRSQHALGHKFAVLFVDLDNFKQVNDAQGHLIGDRVLREASQRLVQCVREGDHVVRFGGDEFVVLVERVNAPAEVESIIRRIHAVLEIPIALPDGEVTLSVSIGAAEAAPEHRSPEDLLAAADRAMYASKRLNG